MSLWETFCQNKGLVDLAQVYEQLLWKLIKKGLIDLAQVYEQLLAKSKSKSMVKKSLSMAFMRPPSGSTFGHASSNLLQSCH